MRDVGAPKYNYRMPYPEMFVAPMRQELTRFGVKELRTADEVDEAVTTTPGTLMIIVNSVCGCAAGKARPGVAMALNHATRPDVVATVGGWWQLELHKQDGTCREWEPRIPPLPRAERTAERTGEGNWGGLHDGDRPFFSKLLIPYLPIHLRTPRGGRVRQTNFVSPLLRIRTDSTYFEIFHIFALWPAGCFF